MKENKTSKKNIFIFILITIILIAIFSVSFITYYNKKKHQKEIENYSVKVEKQIKNDFETFNKDLENQEIKDLEKSNKIKNMIDSYEKYSKNDDLGNQENINKLYKETIDKMKKSMTSKWNEKLKSLTVDDVNSISDKEQINQFISNLDVLNEDITSTKEIAINKNDYEKNFKVKIEELKTKYADRLKAIEEEEKRKAEEEARKAEEEKIKAEEEKRKAEEAARVNAQSSSNSGNSYNSSNSSSNNFSGGGSNWSGNNNNNNSGSGNSNSGGSSSSGNSNSGGVSLIRTERFEVNGIYGTRYFYSDGSVKIVMDSGEVENVEDPNGDIYG